jgi:hypothetical protein
VAADYKSPKRGQLSSSDRERMMRLREEVIGRLTEARLIAARVLDQEPGTVVGMSIRPKPGGGDAPEGHVLVEVIFADDGSAVCYYDPPGVCEPC